MCPSGHELDENLRECKGTLHIKHIVYIVSCTSYAIMISAQVGLLFALQSSYVRRIDLNGTSSSSVTLFTGGNPIAVDYDYRFDAHDLSIVASYKFNCLCSVIKFLLSMHLCLNYSPLMIDKKYILYRNNYLFWSDTSNQRIWRAELDGTNPEMLIRNDIQCVGMYLHCTQLYIKCIPYKCLP